MARSSIISNLADIEIDGELWRSYDKSAEKVNEDKNLQSIQRDSRYPSGYCGNRNAYCYATSVATSADL